MINTCEHPIDKRVNETSYKIPNGNMVFTSCSLCGMKRIESRKNDGSVSTGNWFKKEQTK